MTPQTITVVSASQMTNVQREVLQQKLINKYGQSQLIFKIDPSLVIGFYLIIGDKEIRYDLQSQINNIQNQILA